MHPRPATLQQPTSAQQRRPLGLELFEHMREREIEASQVTYGILLDGCINENQLTKAREVFETMTKAGLPMNTVLYTTKY